MPWRTPVETLVEQRIFGLTAGHANPNGHGGLREDAAFVVLARRLGPVLRSGCAPWGGLRGMAAASGA